MIQFLFILLGFVHYATSSRIFPVRGSFLQINAETPRTQEVNADALEILEKFNTGAYRIIYDIHELEGAKETYPNFLNSLKRTFIRLKVYYKFVEKGETNLFSSWKLLFDILHKINQEMMKAVCSTISTHENPGVSPSGLLYSKMFELTSSWTAFSKTIRDEIDNFLTGDTAAVFPDACRGIYIEDLSDIFDVIASNANGGSLFSSWCVNLDDAISQHFDTIFKMYTHSSVPCDADHKTILLLAKLGFMFFDEMRQFRFALMAREAQFTSICQMDPTKGSYYARKSSMKIAGIETHPMKEIKFVHAAFKIFSLLADNMATSLSDYWDDAQSEHRKHQVLLILTGLEHIKNLIAGAGEIVKLSAPKKTIDELRQVLIILFQMIPVANKAMFMAIEPDLDENLKASIAKYLSDTEENKGSNGQVFLATYNILEGQICQLYRKDPFMASTFFRFIEFSRGLIALSDNLKQVPNIGIYIDSLSLALKLLTETQNYISEAFKTNEKAICMLEYDLARKFVINSLAAFGHLFTAAKIVKGMDKSWYAYLTRRIFEEKSSKFWKQFAGKITSSMLKGTCNDKPLKQKKSKKQPLKSQMKTTKQSKLHGANFIRDDHMSGESFDSENLQIVPGQDKNAIDVEDTETCLILTSSTSDGTSHLLQRAHAQEKPLIDLQAPSIWSEACQYLLPTFRDHFSIRPEFQINRKAISCRVVEKYEEPSHHMVISKQLGYTDTKVDPRDYLMAIILIGQRIWKTKLEPFLMVLQSYENELHLVETFYMSVVEFETELLLLQNLDNPTFVSLLQEASFADAATLFTYIKYYKMRLVVCHPSCPKSTGLKKKLLARHLTAMEAYNVVAPRVITRIRHSAEAYDEIFVKAIETEGRPDDLLSIEHTEAALAVIGAYEMLLSEELKTKRNRFAHEEVSDDTFKAYLNYALLGNPDYKVLSSL